MTLNRPLQFLFYFIITIWLVGIANWVTGYHLNQFGILPRDPFYLFGIFTTPFLHGGFWHLFNNTIGFATLGWLVSLYNGKNENLLLKLTLFVIFWGGLMTWLLARPHYHVGLSGVIFGYWGFVTVNGIFERSFKSIIISLAAFFFYGGMIFGVLPTTYTVSFEGHLFGALSGVAYSYLYRRGRR